MHVGANNKRYSQKLETLCLEMTMEEKYRGIKGYSEMTRSFQLDTAVNKANAVLWHTKRGISNTNREELVSLYKDLAKMSVYD